MTKSDLRIESPQRDEFAWTGEHSMSLFEEAFLCLWDAVFHEGTYFLKTCNVCLHRHNRSPRKRDGGEYALRVLIEKPTQTDPDSPSGRKGNESCSTHQIYGVLDNIHLLTGKKSEKLLWYNAYLTAPPFHDTKVGCVLDCKTCWRRTEFTCSVKQKTTTHFAQSRSAQISFVMEFSISHALFISHSFRILHI